MSIQKLLVQIESNDTTKFHCSQDELCEFLNLPISAAVNAVTAGARPRITMTPEEVNIPISTLTPGPWN